MTGDELLAGRYRTLRLIGTGGMARVFLAEDQRLGRQVAVKRLHAHSPEDIARRFQREARLGAALNHPNLVAVYDVETDGESVLIVMEYVEGTTLADELKAGALGVDRTVAMISDVAAALDAVHEKGIVHRDVKPANVLLRSKDGMAKLADLGIATAAESTRITVSGTVMGTAAYMAP
ncbi:MAG TPA: serine/threonine-protein kinase, partial [Thermoleophilaceae bacterium]|nr:serine/threonine-protein kinase [Thermoleophilaceae bacterium]